MELIKIYDSVLTDDLCRELIKFADSRPGEEEGRLRAVSVRASGPWDQARVAALNSRVSEVVSRLAEQYGQETGARSWWPDSYAMEGLRVKSYDPLHQHYFPPHVDVDRRANSTRFLSFLFYLNDSEAGTRFLWQDLTVSARRGRCLVFPPMWLYPHEGLEPKTEKKYIASTYLHYGS